MNPPPVPLAQLTALRFVAAFAVLLSHLEFLGAAGGGAGWLYETVFRQGYCGVSFFYLLSGFILSHAYGDKLASRAVGWGSYFALRLCRIAPLHWITALAFLVWLALTKGAPGAGTIALNLALLHAWVPDPSVHYALNGPSWSLSDELFFYALFPLLNRVPRRTLTLGLGGAVTAIAAIAVVTLAVHPGYTPAMEWFFYVAPPVRLVDFVAGIVLYRLYRGGFGLRMAGPPAELER